MMPESHFSAISPGSEWSKYVFIYELTFLHFHQFLNPFLPNTNILFSFSVECLLAPGVICLDKSDNVKNNTFTKDIHCKWT